jgi:hypothetical protein
MASGCVMSGCCGNARPLQWVRGTDAYRADAIRGQGVEIVGMRYDADYIYVDTLWRGDAEHVRGDAYRFSSRSSRRSSSRKLVQIVDAQGESVAMRPTIDPPLHWGLGPPPSYTYGHAAPIDEGLVLCVSAFDAMRDVAGGAYTVTVMIPEDLSTAPGARVTRTLDARWIGDDDG